MNLSRLLIAFDCPLVCCSLCFCLIQKILQLLDARMLTRWQIANSIVSF